MNKWGKIWAALLLMALLLLTWTGCGKTEPSGNETAGETEGATSSVQGESKVPQTETETRRMPQIPDADFEGESFDVLHWTVDESWIPWEEIYVETMNGDVLETAVFNRNSEVGEKYHATFSVAYEHVNTFKSKLQTLVSTTAKDYDLCVLRSVTVASIFMQDFFADMRDLSYVDFTNPWWSQSSMDALRTGNRINFCASDYLLMDKSATVCTFFNKAIADEHGEAIGNLYEAVRQGEWTLEKLTDCMAAVATDLNDDGRTNSDGDLVGMVGSDSPVNYLFLSAGGRFMQYNETRNCYDYTFYTQENVDKLQDIFESVMYADSNLNETHTPTSTTKFENDLALFKMGAVQKTSDFRQMKSDYGILPIPMYEKSQGRYFSEVSPDRDSLLFLPATVGEADMPFIGTMLEALGARSYYEVLPVFHDIVLEGKGTRDKESRDMLQLVFETRTYDPGLIFDLAGFARYIMHYTQYGTSDFASAYAEYEGKIDERLKELNNYIAENS